MRFAQPLRRCLVAGIHPGRVQNHARQRQLDLLLVQPLQNTNIDLLLNIHVLVVVRRVNDMDHLEGQAIAIEAQEMGTVKLRFPDVGNDLFDHLTH